MMHSATHCTDFIWPSVISNVLTVLFYCTLINVILLTAIRKYGLSYVHFHETYTVSLCADFLYRFSAMSNSQCAMYGHQFIYSVCAVFTAPIFTELVITQEGLWAAVFLCGKPRAVHVRRKEGKSDGMWWAHWWSFMLWGHCSTGISFSRTND
jgi:hypothetical protein